MKNYGLFIAIVFGFNVFISAQESDDGLSNEPSDKEIGIDLNLSASNFGGTAGLGVKFGIVKNEKFIFGPSVRIQRTWAKYVNTNTKVGYSIYGGGIFTHVRLYDYFFLGGEVEFLSTPFIIGNTYTGKTRSWVPIALIGGGFSRAFSEHFRLNAGIMYDLIDHVNSPLRQGYFMRKNNGALIPVVYRIAFFFPL